MAKTKISEFSATPANNTDIDSINIAEGCAPSGINNAIRELMAQLKDFQTGAVGDSFNGPVGTTTAAAGAFTNLTASGTLGVTGVATLTAQPILSSLTASQVVFTDASKGLVSNAITGTGNVVMSASPTLTGTISGANATLSGTLGVTGVATLGAGAILNTPASVTLTNATGLPLTTGTTGTLGTTKGGTGLTSFTANGVVYASSTSALATGSALTFDGTNLAIGASPTFYGGQVATAGSIAITGGSLLKLWNTGGTGVGGISSPGTDTLSFSVGSGFSEQMRLTSTGLGIGTSSPGSFDSTGNQLVVGNNGAAQGMTIATGPSNAGSIFFAKGTTGSDPYRGFIQYGQSGTAISDSMLFGTAAAERMRLDSAGNLGIGTTSPQARLGVRTSDTYGILVNTNNVSSGTTRISLGGYQDGVAGGGGSAAIGAIHNHSATAVSQLAFYTHDGTSMLERGRFDGSGNLGVGTTSPSLASGMGIAVYNSTVGGAARIALKNGSTGDAAGDGFQLVANGVEAYIEQRENSFLAFTTNNTERMRLDASGNLLVGTTSVDPSGDAFTFQPANKYGVFSHITGTSSGTGYVYFSYAGSAVGSVTQAGTTGVLYNVTSDYRLKDVIGTVSGSGERIDALEPIDYSMKADGSKHRGFLAHKFQEVYPNSVTGTKDEVDAEGKPVIQQMDASTPEVIADLVAELQSLRKRLAALEAA